MWPSPDASRRGRTLPFALVAAGLVAPLATGSVGRPGVAAAASNTVGTCGSTVQGVRTTYRTQYTSSPFHPGYRITGAVLRHIDRSCVGTVVDVTLKRGVKVVGRGTAVVGARIVTVRMRAPRPRAEAITDVRVAFSSDRLLMPRQCLGMTFDMVLSGGRTSENFQGTPFRDLILTGMGNDVVSGLASADCVGGGNGALRITTGRGNDVVVAGRGNDVVSVGPGADRVYLGRGRNVVRLGSGRNILVIRLGGTKRSWVRATTGDNRIRLGDGGGRVRVGNGDNLLTGGKGNDTFVIGWGHNVVNGGGGYNVCILPRLHMTRDRIRNCHVRARR